MAFGHGKACSVYANGRNLSPFFTSASPALSCAADETTTMGKNSKTFIAGLKDATFSCQGYFDSATGASDATLYNAVGATADSLVVIYPHGDLAVGDAGYAMRGRCTSYGDDSEVSSVVALNAEFQGDDDVDRVVSMHVLGAETATGNLATIDDAAATASGAAAHLHVTAITGTNIVITIMHGNASNMSDESALLTFTSATAAGTSERVATSATATVKRYRRINITGTFTSATFHVAWSRK